MTNDWQPIETAPKDGTVFIARDASHPRWGSWPMMRHVEWVFSDRLGDWEFQDGGAWLHILDNTLDFDGYVDIGGLYVPFSYAADDYNSDARYEWMPLPPPPVTP